MSDQPEHPTGADKTIRIVLADPTASSWVKATLQTALLCPPFEVSNDARMLSILLSQFSMCIMMKEFETNQNRHHALLQNIEHNIDSTLKSPKTSLWLKQALTSALLQDHVDAANDADYVYELLNQYATLTYIRQHQR